MEWTGGYVAEIEYTFGYYGELNPLRSRMALLASGYAALPQVSTACELGFGQGLSINIHAAASAAHWIGNDFNPSQAAFAQTIGKSSGAKINVTDESFEEFCVRDDLPNFDFVGLHGIWSWISDANRKIIVDFLRRKLNVGGVVYVSYNTQPGWAQTMPLRHLLTEHARTLGTAGQGTTQRIDQALQFTERLFSTGPAYVSVNSQARERLESLKGHSRNYLAHEYFNRDWVPMHFSTMAQLLSEAKLSFAASAYLLDNLPAINCTSQQQQLLDDIGDPVFKETVRDYIVNQQFRRDYWVKGLRRLGPIEKVEALRGLNVVLVTPATDVTLELKGPVGTVKLQETVYGPLLEYLQDYSVRSVREIEDALKPKGISHLQIVQALMILTGKADVAPAHDKQVAQRIKSQTDKINLELMARACQLGEIQFLASPITGGGFIVSRFHQMFLFGRIKGNKTAETCAAFVWTILKSQGESLLKDGAALKTEDENLAMLLEHAQEFHKNRLPLLKALGIGI